MVAIGFIGPPTSEVQPFTESRSPCSRPSPTRPSSRSRTSGFQRVAGADGELTRSVEELTALAEVGHAVSSSLDLEEVLNTIVAARVQLAGADSGTICEFDAAAGEFVLRATDGRPESCWRVEHARVRRGEGAWGGRLSSDGPCRFRTSRRRAPTRPLREALIAAGTRALLAVPLLRENVCLAVW